MGAEEMAHANWRLDNPPVVDVAVSRRMGLFVVAPAGRPARHPGPAAPGRLRRPHRAGLAARRGRQPGRRPARPVSGSLRRCPAAGPSPEPGRLRRRCQRAPTSVPPPPRRSPPPARPSSPRCRPTAGENGHPGPAPRARRRTGPETPAPRRRRPPARCPPSGSSPQLGRRPDDPEPFADRPAARRRGCRTRPRARRRTTVRRAGPTRAGADAGRPAAMRPRSGPVRPGQRQRPAGCPSAVVEHRDADDDVARPRQHRHVQPARCRRQRPVRAGRFSPLDRCSGPAARAARRLGVRGVTTRRPSPTSVRWTPVLVRQDTGFAGHDTGFGGARTPPPRLRSAAPTARAGARSGFGWDSSPSGDESSCRQRSTRRSTGCRSSRRSSLTGSAAAAARSAGRPGRPSAARPTARGPLPARPRSRLDLAGRRWLAGRRRGRRAVVRRHHLGRAAQAGATG